MLEFISKYWIEFFFGLIATGLLGWVRNDIKQYKELQKRDREDFKQEIESEIEVKLKAAEQDLNLKNLQMTTDLETVHDVLNNLRGGLLSVQGRAFREECQRLLNPSHEITMDEYEELVEDHAAYNGLGGNHKGDALFEAVQTKYHNQITS